jgi:hypothetical protein
MSRIFLALALLLSLTGLASAQTVQQSGQRLDAAQFTVVGTNYNTVNTQAVATVTPPAGQYVYITRIELEAVQDGTATAAVNSAFTSTGLGTGTTASPQWGFSIAATADATLYRDVNLSVPLRSAVPGQNVVITSPAATLHLGFGVKVYGYFSP